MQLQCFAGQSQLRRAGLGLVSKQQAEPKYAVAPKSLFGRFAIELECGMLGRSEQPGSSTIHEACLEAATDLPGLHRGWSIHDSGRRRPYRLVCGFVFWAWIGGHAGPVLARGVLSETHAKRVRLLHSLAELVRWLGISERVLRRADRRRGEGHFQAVGIKRHEVFAGHLWTDAAGIGGLDGRLAEEGNGGVIYSASSLRLAARKFVMLKLDP